MTSPVPAPATEAELLHSAASVAGLTVGELARDLGWQLPPDARRAKGFVGQLVEAALGATAGSLPEPDFQRIGVELKTVPVDATGQPVESTYVCTVPMAAGESSPVWEHSNVRRKLARVLWLPVEAPGERDTADRRLGSAVLWSPSAAEEHDLRADWEELTELIMTGRVARITAHRGACLQVRPKAADASARRWGVDESGRRVRTLPRGFYLRTGFTAAVLRRCYAGLGR